ncbi:MAG TPA: OmpH family outer membrane protein [Candidatus Barnesiella excrementipullorum]|uniref:OmpH family outer membrane protein n=1 Tax=Candidatus Barnesiella excrementipullorum TaxID=2838479 RepID=A0A9D1VPW4_9BACT|nr:OmpH family outer membrane protein [Candidatus Barnesiella excrementipullorum]
MFKKLIIAVLCCLPMSLMAQTAFKFGTVNSAEIIAAMPERAAAEQQLQDLSKKYEDEFVKVQEEFQNKYKELQALGDTVPETIRMRRLQEVQESQQRIESFRTMAQEDIAKKQEELFIPIQQKLMDAIKAVGEEGKFTYIFDLTYPVVLYQGVGNEDITPLVKAKLGIQ